MCSAVLQKGAGGLICSHRPCGHLPRQLAAAGAARSAVLRQAMAATNGRQPVIIFDVMDTIVHDPFYQHMPAYFNMTFKELLAAKHPTAWIEFERGLISESEFLHKFFADGRSVDGPGLVSHMVAAYRYIDGMPELLQRLQDAGVTMHIMSNYPSWHRYIEQKLQLSRYLPWTFISCEGPMQGLRKPSPEAFQVVKEVLGPLAPGQQLLFVDDRPVNVEAATAGGMVGLHFQGSAAQLEQQLRAAAVEF